MRMWVHLFRTTLNVPLRGLKSKNNTTYNWGRKIDCNEAVGIAKCSYANSCNCNLNLSFSVFLSF